MSPHAPIEPELERCIVRMLDGQLDEAQKAELYRQVLRNPGAHRILSDYTANDQLAADALHSLLDGPVAPPSPRLHRQVAPAGGGAASGASAPQGRPLHQAGRRWGLSAAALAAGVAVLVGGLLIVGELSSQSSVRPPAIGDAGGAGGADAIAINGGEDEPVGASPSRQPGDGREAADFPSPVADPAVATDPPDSRPAAAPPAAPPAVHSAGRGFVGIVDPHTDTIIYIQVDDGDADAEVYADF